MRSTLLQPSRNRVPALAILALALWNARAFAQCPDGTPPPCKSASSASALARRANPPLNVRAWIVVPFGNVMKAQELDWLRDASVNLLSMDMSRWTDISVVPDKRVGDLMRELAASDGMRPLTLNDGLSVARRAGAGMLVMGDFFRLGKGARIVANVFDVRSGRKLRSAVREAAEPDSLLTAFSPLARGVLAVAPPPDAKTGDLGTSSIDAYQAYLLGVQALNRFHLEEARLQLTRALTLDSTFALAHLKLSLALSWGEQSLTSAEAKAHALAAQRLGSRLPPRERALIAGRVASANQDHGLACASYAPLVARDSSDVEALYLYGDCSFHDNAVVLLASDTTAGAFRGSWNRANWAFERVLDLDPGYHPAFEHILDVLRASERAGCVLRTPNSPCEFVSARVLLDGDTLLTRPLRVELNPAAWRAQVERGAREAPQLTNLREARRIAQRWVDADSTEARAQLGLARVLLALGNLPEADAHLQRVPPRAMPDNFPALWAKMEVAAKRGRGAESRAAFDSLVKAYPDQPSLLRARGSLELMFGRTARMVTGYSNAFKARGPEAVAYYGNLPRVLLGVPRAELGRDEVAYLMAIRDTTCKVTCRADAIYPSLAFALRASRTTWPAFGALEATHVNEQPARALSLGDTAALRRIAWNRDSLAHRNVSVGWWEEGWSVIAADSYLALGDSAAALRTARFFVDTAMAPSSLLNQVVGGAYGAGALWPRMMLLRADLAAAAGIRTEAMLWYDRVLDLWADADAELRPVVERIRTARAALGTR